MSHTKGPWTISSDFNNPAHEDKTCSIKGGEDDFFLAEICGDRPNHKDDARLIAAAPSLAFELNKALTALRSPQSFEIDDVCSDIEAVLRLAGVR